MCRACACWVPLPLGRKGTGRARSVVEGRDGRMSEAAVAGVNERRERRKAKHRHCEAKTWTHGRLRRIGRRTPLLSFGFGLVVRCGLAHTLLGLSPRGYNLSVNNPRGEPEPGTGFDMHGTFGLHTVLTHRIDTNPRRLHTRAQGGEPRGGDWRGAKKKGGKQSAFASRWSRQPRRQQQPCRRQRGRPRPLRGRPRAAAVARAAAGGGCWPFSWCRSWPRRTRWVRRHRSVLIDALGGR